MLSVCVDVVVEKFDIKVFYMYVIKGELLVKLFVF